MWMTFLRADRTASDGCNTAGVLRWWRLIISGVVGSFVLEELKSWFDEQGSLIDIADSRDSEKKVQNLTKIAKDQLGQGNHLRFII